MGSGSGSASQTVSVAVESNSNSNRTASKKHEHEHATEHEPTRRLPFLSAGPFSVSPQLKGEERVFWYCGIFGIFNAMGGFQTCCILASPSIPVSLCSWACCLRLRLRRFLRLRLRLLV